MSFFQVASVAAMSATLVLGGRLPHLALVVLLTQVGTELTRVVVAHRVCPQLLVRPRYATWKQARKMLSFGAKSSLGAVASLLLFQGNNILVARVLGPAALAVFARPLALLRVVETFANKFGFVLTPTASSLQHQGRRAEVRELFLDGARMGGGLVVPPILGLIILGQQLLLVWMGPRYSQTAVVSILALGALVRLAQQSIISVLVGLNMHGRPALAGLFVAMLGLGIGVANSLYLGWGLVGFALALSVPQYLGAAYTAQFACRRLEIPLRVYLRETLGVPLLAAVPFAVVLVLARLYLAPRSPALALAAGTGLGIAVLAPPYWRFVVPAHFRDQLLRLLSWKRLRSRRAIPA
jgi:O-antigen/teichoic acid export membrane protein